MPPKTEFADRLHAEKYRSKGEDFREAMNRIAAALSDNDQHYRETREILLEQRFLPAGRVQAGVGSGRNVTASNCFVVGPIEDSSDSILLRHSQAYHTLRMGGGVGYDFSRLRPRGDRIKSLDSRSSGPIAFMEMFHACCKTVQSAGHRRGAMMGVVRCDHPDIEEFISAKQDRTSLTTFNISVGVTDEFMLAVAQDKSFALRFEGRVYKEVRARDLWEKIMRSTWDWAEPGILFLDTINRMNNLRYCENLEATNPCGEQPLPSNGACLLGSFNLAKYVYRDESGARSFDFLQLDRDVAPVVRAMDNIIDRSKYPLPEQAEEARQKRRMGLGITGAANAIEWLLGRPSYGDAEFVAHLEGILSFLAVRLYRESAALAEEKGPFPLFSASAYQSNPYIQRLPAEVQRQIIRCGLRNSHLVSIAPTGTISLCADNVSSGIEPVFGYDVQRSIYTEDGPQTFHLKDYGVKFLGIEGRKAEDVTLDQHLDVLCTAQRWSDSAVSKTVCVPSTMPWDQFKELYFRAWRGGAKGLSTFTIGGAREGVICTLDGSCAD